MARELLFEEVSGERVSCGLDHVGDEKFVQLALEDFFGLATVKKCWLAGCGSQRFEHLAEKRVANELVKGFGKKWTGRY
jgi:hypothetical protein